MKPITYFVCTQPIEALIERYGDYLEHLTVQEKMSIASILTLALSDGCSLAESIEVIDPDAKLNPELCGLLEGYKPADDPDTCLGTVEAIVALVRYGAPSAPPPVAA